MDIDRVIYESILIVSVLYGAFRLTEIAGYLHDIREELKGLKLEPRNIKKSLDDKAE